LLFQSNTQVCASRPDASLAKLLNDMGCTRSSGTRPVVAPENVVSLSP
jgi:hypothetical protein